MRCVAPWMRYNEEKHERQPTQCGSCGACLANRRMEWSFRLKEEERHCNSAFFLTLTYRDGMIPVHKSGNYTLRKRDIQLYMKKLRKAVFGSKKGNWKYYVVGEYGSKTKRPHYHMILFNFPREKEELFQEKWRVKGIDIGMVHIGKVNSQSIHYVTKYHVNYKNDVDPWQELRQKEFALMSKGIGEGYIKRVGEWHNRAKAMYVVNNGFKQRMPRYYKERLIDDQVKEEMLLDAIYEAEKAEENEISRLDMQGYIGKYEFARRQMVEAKKIKKNAKRQDRI